jgi:hypothetical protein
MMMSRVYGVLAKHIKHITEAEIDHAGFSEEGERVRHIRHMPLLQEPHLGALVIRESNSMIRYYKLDSHEKISQPTFGNNFNGGFFRKVYSARNVDVGLNSTN